MATLKYWVWLSELAGLNNVSKLLLLQHFGSPEEIYYAGAEEYAQVEGLKKEQGELLHQKSLQRAEDILQNCAKDNIFLITLDDALYPNRLKNIYDPPILLYGKGNMPLFDEEVPLTIVGTRSCTPYGVQCAETLGYDLARQGAIVVSGMAKGVDSAALKGCLRAGGFPCAVFGCGVDVVYPAENRRLYEDILAVGVALSEYPPQTDPEPWRFPQRNRIMSGLSVGTIVAEAPERSGALITARDALEQGRDVFAVPGPINAPGSAGCLQLIREGAVLTRHAWDVLEEYAGRYPHKLRRREGDVPPEPEKAGVPESQPEKAKKVPGLPVLDLKKNTAGLTDDQMAVLRILPTDSPMLTDEVAEATGISIRRVLSALTVLEIDGYAKKNGAQSFTSAVTILDEGEQKV